jgi:hypothetical protein
MNSGNLAGVPCSLDFQMALHSASEAFAILYYDPITRKAIQGSEIEVKEWGKSNAKYILEKFPDTREHGFFLVTATLRTRRCSLGCWSGTTRSIESTGNVSSLLPVGFLGGHIKSNNQHSGWITCPSNDDLVLKPILAISN